MSALFAPPRPAFRAVAGDLPEVVRGRMIGRSWRADDARCPRFDELAYVTCTHVTMDGGVDQGELVVARALAVRAIALLGRLYAIGFPIRQLRLVDDYGADDDASMAADNSSAFNFRVVAGTELLSQHARGLAIDLNPQENPWRLGGGRVLPECGRAFVDRRDVRKGMIVRPGPVVSVLDELGWEWGGDWRHASDDHHVVWSRGL